MQGDKEHTSFKEYYEEFKETLTSEVFPRGFRKFPRDFYDEIGAADTEFENYPTNGKPLSIHPFFEKHELKDKKGNTILEVDSPVKAELAELLSKTETYVFKIPKDDAVTGKLLEAYRTYIKKVRTQLLENALSKVDDQELAEKVTRDIIEQAGR